MLLTTLQRSDNIQPHKDKLYYVITTYYVQHVTDSDFDKGGDDQEISSEFI